MNLTLTYDIIDWKIDSVTQTDQPLIKININKNGNQVSLNQQFSIPNKNRNLYAKLKNITASNELQLRQKLFKEIEINKSKSLYRLF